MASITKTANGYRAQVYVKGRRDSETHRTRREAEAWGAARETELRTAAALPVGQRHTLAQALNKYAEEVSPGKRGERWELLRLAAFQRDQNFPVGKIGEITPDAIAAWKLARLKQVTPGTVLREMNLLSAVFEIARREWRWLPANPMRDVSRPKQPDHREVLITRAQIRQLLTVMGYPKARPVRTVAQAVAVCFLVALRTGMRAGELCALTWDDVRADFVAVKATAKGAGKTGRRDVSLSPKAKRLIEQMRGFDPVKVFGLSAPSLDAMFRKYRQRAGLEGFTFHDSRHTAATWNARKIHVLALCKMFGWTDPKMAMTYYNPTASDIAKQL